MIEHGGHLAPIAAKLNCNPAELLDFSVNLHPDGTTEGLTPHLFRALTEIAPYPEPHAESLAAFTEQYWRLEPGRVLWGNGSTELLALIPRALPVCRARIVTPGYLEYAACCRAAGLEVAEFPLSAEADFRMDFAALDGSLLPGELLIAGNPGNPTGVMEPITAWHDFIRRHPENFFLIDEAFADFAGATLLSLPPLDNLLILRSLTKFHAVAGLRLGYVVASRENIDRLRDAQSPWSLGPVAVRAAEFLLGRTRADVAPLREAFAAELRKRGITVFPSSANYLLCRAERPLREALLRHKIVVRDCADYTGLDACYCRIAVRCEADNARLLAALDRILGATPFLAPAPRRVPALMLQGTCSNAGKSVLAAAFCRIMTQDGLAVAPFKAQNMALNSCVTPDGGEIGRAQALQAAACRIDPQVRMNPILLKPESDRGSQLVLMGHATGHYSVSEYFARKGELRQLVHRAYDELSVGRDCMILEGAGSPGEVNLKHADLVNMSMARYAGARVLLAGDIDRGGVYASFIGNFATFEPWERDLLSGFLVNKFRGDPALLADAHTYVADMTGKPVLGVIDLLPDLGLPEEDSVGFAFEPKLSERAAGADTLDLALIHVGHIANFTDYAPLAGEPGVTVRAVRDAASLGSPDAIILPGSKSVAADMAALRANGLAAAIAASPAYKIGICGGLQMLGRRLLDPEAVESDEPEVGCFGMIPVTTVMRRKKMLRRTVIADADGTRFAGYEIHHGESRADTPDCEVLTSGDGRELLYRRDGVFATYLHGVFDDDAFRHDFLAMLRARCGKPPRRSTFQYGVEPALNRLADHVRSRVDMARLYRELGVKK